MENYGNTNGFPREPEYTPEEKKESKVLKVLKAIFVKNIGYKILAVVLAAGIWVLAVGLG